jgi:hypothetical protein
MASISRISSASENVGTILNVSGKSSISTSVVTTTKDVPFSFLLLAKSKNKDKFFFVMLKASEN